MSDAPELPRDLADVLRDAFDTSFGARREDTSRDDVDLLAMLVGEDPWALRLTDLVSVQPLERLVPVAGPHRAFLGLAGTRGRAIPVYGLAALLGRGVAAERPAWLVLVQAPGGVLIGLAPDAVVGHLRVARDALAPDPTAAADEDVVVADGRRWRVPRVARLVDDVLAATSATTAPPR